jgi:hypothetical protein
MLFLLCGIVFVREKKWGKGEGVFIRERAGKVRRERSISTSFL